MFRDGKRTAVLACVLATAAFVAGAGTASAHENPANCQGPLAPYGALFEGTCTFAFQGYPIGMAAMYQPSATGPILPSEIHVEVVLQPAFGTPQSLSMECYDPQPDADGVVPKVYRTTRCRRDYNSPQTDLQFTLLQPIPTQIVSMQCSAHSHAPYSRAYPPYGLLACWSGIPARQDLENDGVFAAMGF